MKQAMIVFGEDYGRYPTSTQHIINQLTDHYDIYWVNSLGLRMPKLNGADIKRACRKLSLFFCKNTSSQSRFREFNLMILPFFGNKIIDKINTAYLTYQVKNIIEKYNLAEPIMFFSTPLGVYINSAIQTSARVYYCCDDFSHLSGVDHKPIQRMEKKLVDHVDLLFVTSSKLAEKFTPHESTIISHGVTDSFFETPLPRPSDLPNDKNVAGYYGSMAEWLDWDLIEHCLVGLPNWTFVFIGPKKYDFSHLMKHKNFIWLGPRTHAELPAYVAHWHVSLIPFKNNQQIQSANPLKLREYLAIGQPIVATSQPEIEHYADVIQIANSKEQFLEEIRRSVQHSNTSKRKASVRSEGWSKKAQTLNHAIQKHIS